MQRRRTVLPRTAARAARSANARRLTWAGLLQRCSFAIRVPHRGARLKLISGALSQQPDEGCFDSSLRVELWPTSAPPSRVKNLRAISDCGARLQSPPAHTAVRRWPATSDGNSRGHPCRAHASRPRKATHRHASQSLPLERGRPATGTLAGLDLLAFESRSCALLRSAASASRRQRIASECSQSAGKSRCGVPWVSPDAARAHWTGQAQPRRSSSCAQSPQPIYPRQGMRIDRQLSPPSILTNSETSSVSTSRPNAKTRPAIFGKPAAISTASLTRTQLAA